MDAALEARKRELLEECRVPAEVFRQVEPRLRRFLEPFVRTFARQEPCAHAATYVSGLLSDLESKNVESIAYRFGQERLPLQRFIGWAEWDDAPLRDELARQIGANLGEAGAVLVFDPSGYPKSGRESVGVARQWCGRLGKTDNCQVAVYLGYVSSKEHALVDVRLYLPKEWTQDKARLEKAGVPKPQRKFRTRHELCLEMLAERGPVLPHAWVAGDDELGRPSWFRRRLRELHERYLLAVPSNTMIRDLEVEPPAGTGRGRPPQRPWQSVSQWAAAQPASAWTTIDVRDGSKGPLFVQVLSRRVRTRNERRQESPDDELLVVIRYRDRENQAVTKTDYFLSNAETDTPLAEFTRVAKAEHRIEECLERGKSELGLADYEVRNWTGWQHHQTLSLVAAWFLVTETQRGKTMDPRDHVPTTPRGPRRDPASSLALRHARAHPPRTRTTPTPQRTRPAVPLETTQTIGALELAQTPNVRQSN
jgi:SRSO17 transposase